MTPPDDLSLPAGDPLGARVILFVDDESYIRDLGALVLRQSGFEVLLAEDGARAIDVYRREGQRIDLVILDLTMPNLSGAESLRQLAALDPDVRVLLSSGSLGAEPTTLTWPQVCGFIPKPYRASDLVNAVRTALEP